MHRTTPPETDPHATAADPLIDEVRQIRRELSERFDNDPVRLGEYVHRVSQEHQKCHPPTDPAVPPAVNGDASP
jgi:hypothetical protein